MASSMMVAETTIVSWQLVTGKFGRLAMIEKMPSTFD